MNQNNIKPQELRPNCLVMYKWFEKSSIDGKQKTTIHRETIKILGIDSANNRVLTKTNQTRKNHTWISIDKIRPIPLSEEVLLRCGFEKEEDDNDRFVFNNDIVDYIIDTDVEGTFLIGVRPISDIIYFSWEIKHLHQLQNLFYSLTQCDLEINFLI